MTSSFVWFTVRPSSQAGQDDGRTRRVTKAGGSRGRERSTSLGWGKQNMSTGFFSHVHVQVRQVRAQGGRTLCIALSVLLSLLLVGAVSPAAAEAAALGSTRIDLKVLVVDDGTVGVRALVAEMDREGVPYDKVGAGTPITAATGSAAGTLEGPTAQAPRGYYQAVVMSGANGLSAPDLATLAAYERKFGVRQVDANVFLGGDYGLGEPWSGPLDGLTATVSAAGLAGPFGYLKGSVTIDDFDANTSESYGYLAPPVAAAPGTTFQPLLTGPIPHRAPAGGTGTPIGGHTHNR